VEPYQGAATGVGGINRDIFTMGARPVAQLNSLRFGDLKQDHTKWLMKGVVRGIGDYGNSFGVPVVAGEVFFDDSFNSNPLVNAMSVGIVRKDRIISATARGAGNPVFIIGSSTGKDGIHGATFASADLHENSADDIPSVQVGDPFQEKKLLEATLELNRKGAIAGMQDMGAAGIICSTSEMSARGKCGMKIYLDKVPLRQKNIEPWEILLSESQERMLLVAEKGNEQIVKEVFEKWDLVCVIIGEVINEDRLFFYMNNKLVADIPASSLVLGGGAPVYERKSSAPAYLKEIKKYSVSKIPEPSNLREVAWFLMKQPNLASKRWVIEQYDTMVGTANMSTNFPSDAGVVNIKGTNRALALTVDCNPRYVRADPETGTAIAVAEAARNIVCSGGKPIAITNCLNFGNPYNPEVFWQFTGAIKGMAEACHKFGTPVTGGNVSFYNQTNLREKIEPVYPTPTIGMLGIIENKNHLMTLSFKNKGNMIYLIGESKNDISSSEYLVSYHNVKNSPAPWFDIDFEMKLHSVISELIRHNLINSAHDVSDGGLFMTLLESSIQNSLGFDITGDAEIRPDAFLFGESQGRIVVTVTPHRENEFIDYMIEKKFPFSTLGHVTKGEMRIDDESYGFIEDAKQEFFNAIERIIG
jgi:phosphoribosylformylglycinamidine synthase